MNRPLLLGWALALATPAFAQLAIDQRFEYDPLGRPTAVIDAAGNTERSDWDPLGRLRSHTDPLGHTTHFGYGAHARPTQVTAPNGAHTTYHVDGLGQVSVEHSPDRGTTTTIHDAAGNLVSRIDARGARIDTRYDALDRPIERRLLRPDGSLEATHTLDWDSAGIGRLAAIDTGHNRLAFDYDAAGRLTGRSYTAGALLLGVRWLHDPANGRVLALTYPSGSTLNPSYDAAGRIVRLDWDGVSIAADIAYAPFGPPTAWRLANGLLHQRTHDSAGRLQSFSLAGEPITLHYDAAGRIEQLQPLVRIDAVQRFHYDAAGRLIRYEGQPHDEAFTYDPNANRLSHTFSATTEHYTYAPASNRLTAYGALQLSHDPAGNRLADQRTYGYDAAGRLSAVTTVQGTTTYRYNGLGERVTKHSGPNTRHFAYDAAGRLIGEYDDLGRPLAEYAWLDAHPIALRRYRYEGTHQSVELFAIETDHLATPRIVTDAAQRVRWRWHATPFGDTPPDENPEGAGPLQLNLRFPGQYHDHESGLHYNYFRDYEPGTGRYVQSDPIGLAGGVNTYAYVNGNPLSFTDPTGEVAQVIAGGATGGLGGLGGFSSGGGKKQNFYDNPNAVPKENSSGSEGNAV